MFNYNSLNWQPVRSKSIDNTESRMQDLQCYDEDINEAESYSVFSNFVLFSETENTNIFHYIPVALVNDPPDQLSNYSGDNICWINSMLQGLKASHSFREEILKSLYTKMPSVYFKDRVNFSFWERFIRGPPNIMESKTNNNAEVIEEGTSMAIDSISSIRFPLNNEKTGFQKYGKLSSHEIEDLEESLTLLSSTLELECITRINYTDRSRQENSPFLELSALFPIPYMKPKNMI